MRPDITTPADVDRLVAHFYSQLLTDELVGFFFTDVARIDLPSHLPKISRFWQQQLFGLFPEDRSRTFEVHLALHRKAALQAAHFNRWLHVFHASVDALFEGPRATLAKQRATGIANSMLQALDDRFHNDGSSPEEQGRVGEFIPPPAPHQ